MKIVLDLAKLVAEGRLTEAQAQELQALAQPQTTQVAISIMMTFGVVAIAAGVLALLPTLATTIAIGAEPLSILLAGVLVVAIAVGLWRYNARSRPGVAAA